jgi:hypothetical protein
MPGPNYFYVHRTWLPNQHRPPCQPTVTTLGKKLTTFMGNIAACCTAAYRNEFASQFKNIDSSPLRLPLSG